MKEAPLIHIITPDSITPVLLSELNHLIPQLSRSATLMDMDHLQRIVHTPCTDLFVAKEDANSTLFGMLTLVHFAIPTGIRAWIEDVVVDEKARGRGIGAALTQAAIQHARTLGAKTLDLTSNSTRQQAHHMYQSAGFTARDTCVFRLLP